jgi:hypothetical protein
MVQAAHSAEPDDAPRAPVLREVPTSGVDDADAGQVAAEAKFVRAVLYGVLIGMVVCAAVWVGLVAVAVAGDGEPLGPVLWMAAGIGVFAGVFFGGWAGSMVGARALERHERNEARAAAAHEPRT